MLWGFDFNPWLIAPLIASVYLLVSGAWAFLRDPRKPVRLAFLALTASLSGIYFFQAFIYSVSQETPVIPLQQAILIFILLSGVTLVIFIKTLLRIHGWNRAFTVLYIITGIFVVLNLTPWAIDFSRLHPLPWNMAPSLTPLGQLMMLFFQAEVLFALYLAWITYHDEKVILQVRHRGRIVFIATLIGSVSAVDFWHYYGIAVPPVGAVFISIWMTLFLYAMSKYRILEITPESAASAIIEAIPGALFITDNDGKIVISNSIARKLSGFSLQELSGMSLEKLFPKMSEYFLRRDGFEMEGEEFELHRRSGSAVQVSVTASRIRQEFGVLTGFIFIATDISRIYEKMGIIERQKDELKKSFEEMHEVQGKLVGREKRMIELKQEIVALNEKLKAQNDKQ